MKTFDQPLLTSPALDAAGIRAYASYFAIWFLPALLCARALGFLVDASGATHATLYSLAVILASQRLLERFFHGQRRIVQFRERHPLALHCSAVTAIATLVLTLFAARIGLVSFSGEPHRAASAEVLMIAGLPLLWAMDYALFRFVFSEIVGVPLFAWWRRRQGQRAEAGDRD